MRQGGESIDKKVHWNIFFFLMTTSEIIWVKNNWEIHTSVPKCSSEVDLFSGVFRNTKPYSLPQYFMVRKVLGSMGRGQLLWRVTLKGPRPTLTPGLIWRQTWETWWLHLRLEFTIGNAAFVTGTRRTVLHLMTFSKWCEKTLTFLLENL